MHSKWKTKKDTKNNAEKYFGRKEIEKQKLKERNNETKKEMKNKK